MAALTDSYKVDRGFRRLSLVLCIGSVGALAAIISTIPEYGLDAFALSGIGAALLFFGVNLSFLLVRTPGRWMPVVQASAIALVGLASAVLSPPSSYEGMIIVAISVPLFAKHGAVRSRIGALLMLAGAVVIDTVVSFLRTDADAGRIIGVTAMTIGVFAIVYYAFYDEIQSLLRDVRDLQTTARASESSFLELRKELARATIAYDAARTEADAAGRHVQLLEEQVHSFEASARPVDVDQFELTEREIDVLRILVQTRSKNRDIGDVLGITERTVKSHIYTVCNKVGVDTRLELVELFRLNWPDDDLDAALSPKP